MEAHTQTLQFSQSVVQFLTIFKHFEIVRHFWIVRRLLLLSCSFSRLGWLAQTEVCLRATSWTPLLLVVARAWSGDAASPKCP